MNKRIITGLLLLVIALQTSVSGQGRFQSFFGRQADDYFFNATFTETILETKEGHYLVLGTSKQFSNTREDMVITEIDAEGNVLNSKRFGGNSPDQAHSIHAVSDGYLLTGFSASFTANSAGYLVKVDKQLNHQWSKAYVGNGIGLTFKAKRTSDNGLLLLGVSFSRPNQGTENFHVVKLDENQNIQWERILGTSQHRSYGFDVVEVNDGYLIAGARGLLSDFGKLYKINNDGTVAWINAYQHANRNLGFVKLEKHNNELYLFGYIDTANGDLLVANTDLNGNINWAKSYGGSAADAPVNGAVEPGKAIKLYGTTQSYGPGNEDYYFLETDMNGNFQSAKAYGTNGIESLSYGLPTWEGGNALFGISDQPSIGQNDFYLVKTDTSYASGCREQNAGATVKDLTLLKKPLPDSSFVPNSKTTNPATQVNQVSLTSGKACSDCVYNPRAGFTSSKQGNNTYSFTNEAAFAQSIEWQFGDTGTSTQANPTYQFPQSGEYQVCQIVTNACGTDSTCQTLSVSTGIESNTSPAFSMYPNPVGDELNLDFTNANAPIQALSMMNAKGQLVYENPSLTDNQVQINTANMESGIYFIRLVSHKGTFTKKVSVK